MSEDGLLPEAFDLGRLKAAGIRAPEQVLLWLPVRHEDYSRVEMQLAHPIDGARRVYSVTVDRDVQAERVQGIPRFKFRVTDGAISAWVTAFGDGHLWQKLSCGNKVVLEAELSRWEQSLFLKSPKRIPDTWVGRVVPRYRGKKGVCSEETVFQKTREALGRFLPQTCAFLLANFGRFDQEAEILCRIGVRWSFAQTLRAVHAPRTAQEAEWAMGVIRRLAAFMIVDQARRAKVRRPVPASALEVKDKALTDLIAALPFPPTSHQRRCFNEIVADLRSPYPMNRLLSGDVGTGKTLTFLLPLLAARASGAKVAILVPNSLLVKQVIREVGEFFGKCGVPCPTLGIDAGVRVTASALEGNPLIVGTTALIKGLQRHKWVPDILVTDEQHKFSRGQREAIKAEKTNFLEATATCIPRTMALATHGAMEISVLSERPVQRQVLSRIVLPEERSRLVSHTQKIIAAGDQVAMIYPLVAVDDDSPDAKKGVVQAARLWESHFPGRVACLHGAMDEQEKQAVIDGMREKRFDLLCSSTVIEIGVTLPSLKSLVVIDAERYGTSQLHQLRGRVARAGGTGYFFMMTGSEPPEADTTERLTLLTQIDDGFQLAERDMAMRGFGDMSEDASLQHGAALTLFNGLRLTPGDLQQIAQLEENTPPLARAA